MFPLGFFFGVIVSLAFVSAGALSSATGARIREAEQLCQANGGLAKINAATGTAECANGARFTEAAKRSAP